MKKKKVKNEEIGNKEDNKILRIIKIKKIKQKKKIKIIENNKNEIQHKLEEENQNQIIEYEDDSETGGKKM